MSDAVRAQRLDTWTWTFCVVAATLTDACASLLAGAVRAEVCVPTEDRFLPPLFLMAAALVNGTHGLGFAHKIALMGIVLFDACILLIAMCPDSTSAIVIALSQAGAIGVGAALARLTQIRTRAQARTRELEPKTKPTPEPKPGVTVAHVAELHHRTPPNSPSMPPPPPPRLAYQHPSRSTTSCTSPSMRSCSGSSANCS